MKSKVEAFTVMEMLINIVITSIVIGMVYFTYSSFSKQILIYQEDIEKETELNSFLLQLKTDFFKAEKIVVSSDKSFDIIYYNTQKIIYETNNDFILRKQHLNTDSLAIKEIDLTTITNSATQEKLIEKVVITTYLFDEPIVFVAGKKYPTVIAYTIADGN